MTRMYHAAYILLIAMMIGTFLGFAIRCYYEDRGSEYFKVLFTSAFMILSLLILIPFIPVYIYKNKKNIISAIITELEKSAKVTFGKKKKRDLQQEINCQITTGKLVKFGFYLAFDLIFHLDEIGINIIQTVSRKYHERKTVKVGVCRSLFDQKAAYFVSKRLAGCI
jgi:hypothetical protein